jgi:hypothetical protein
MLGNICGKEASGDSCSSDSISVGGLQFFQASSISKFFSVDMMFSLANWGLEVNGLTEESSLSSSLSSLLVSLGIDLKANSKPSAVAWMD